MTIDIKKLGRKVLAVFLAIVLYYIVHEGAHLIFALATGTFEKINFMFPGIQIQTNINKFSKIQLGIFSMLGVIATLTTAYTLLFVRKKITLIRSILLIV